MSILTYSISLDQAIVITFLVITMGIGIVASKSINTFKDYALSKTRYDLVAITFSLIATMVGGASTSGTIAEIYSHGLVYAVASTGFIVGIILLAKFIAPKFDNRFDGMVSSSDMIKKYFGYNAEKLSALISCIQCLGTISAQIVVLGHLSTIFFDLNYEKAVIVMGAIITLYSLVGGIKAVTNTDIFQFVTIFIAFPIIANISVAQSGGVLEILSKVPERYLSVLESKHFLRHLLLFIFWSTPFSLIYPVIVHRLLIARSANDIVKMSYTYALFKIVILIVLVAIAFSALVLYPNINPKSVVPIIIKDLLPIGLSGIAISGIIAVTMSSADSFLNTASVILTKNLFNSTGLKAVKLNTLILGILAIYIASRDLNIINVSVVMNTLIYLSVSIPLFFIIMKVHVERYIYWFAVIVGGIAFIISGYYFKLGYEACFISEISCFLIYITFLSLSARRVEIHKLVKAFCQLTPTTNIVEYIKNTSDSFVKKSHDFLLSEFEVTKKQYLQFTIFFSVTYASSYFMWVTHVIDKNIIILRVLSGLLPMGLLLRNKLHSTRSKKLYSIYWYVNLIVCLPLLATVIFLLEGNSLSGIVNVCFSIFLLSVLVSWRMFILVSLIGVFLGYAYINIFFNNFNAIEGKGIYILFCLLFISISIGLIFSRNKEIDILDRMHKMEYMGMQIAHEVRTPLSDVSFSIQLIKKIFNSIIPKANNQKIILEIEQDTFNVLNNTLKKCPDKIKLGSDLVKNLLLSLKKGSLISERNYCSVKKILKATLKVYQKEVDFDEEHNKDIYFYGSELYMLHCFHNIIKNAVKYAHVSKKSKLKIYIKQNMLFFEDKGPGIDVKDKNKIFDAYYTSSDTGVGLGLAFCKDVMESINGSIKCESELNSGTRMILTYPKAEV